MFIIPAIDLKDGECVRLKRGDYATVHKVAKDALETAKRFQADGAEWIHMVDLDGAKDGRPVNSQEIFRVQEQSGLKVEAGGGIRTMDTVEFYLSRGISRVILGSAAISNPDFVREAVKKYGEQIAVGIDARDGMVAAEGWTSTSRVNYLEMAKRMEEIGVQYLIFTDISCDGMLSGPNLEKLDHLANTVSCHIVASGGVSSLKDIINLQALHIYGTICGKAIYTGDLDLRIAVSLCRSVSK